METNIKLIISFVILLAASNASAVDPRLNWNTIESQHFYIHYADGYERLAQKAANSAEQTHLRLESKINWQPDDKTHLVLSDETDSPNGFATPINFNRSVLFMAPPDSTNTLEDFNDWLDTLITHEYTHTLHLDKVSGGAGILRSIFGRQFLFFPNLYQPGWFIEGLATYHETDELEGIGRGQSTLYKMMMRTEVSSGIKPVSQVNLPIRSWPMGTVAYLYGVHFYQFIEEVYGQENVEKLIENYSNNVIPFMINTNSQQLFDKDITELWDEFSIWLKRRYMPEISELKTAGLVEGKKISDSGYNTGQVEVTNNEEVYYIESGAFEHAQLVRRTDDITRTVTEVHSGAKINIHPDSGVLVIQDEFCDEYNLYSDIYLLEKNDSDLKQITKCGRYRSASWTADGKSIIAVKTEKAKSQLVLLNKQGKEIKSLWQGNDTDIITQLKFSPSGMFIIAAVFRTKNGWNIEEFDINKLKWTAITNDRYIDMYPAYSDNGESILFSSERSGQYQIYRYKKNSRYLQQLTRVAGGAFNPQQINQQSALYYVGYNSNGRDIYQLENVEEVSKAPLLEETLKQLTLAPIVETGKAEEYSALSSMRPRWWFPFISLNEDRNEYGLITSGNDALGIHNYQLDFAYDTSNDWLVGNINYSYANRFSIGYRRSTEIIRDNLGEFAVARSVDDIFFSIGFNQPGIESQIQYQLGAVVSESTDGSRALGVPELDDTKDNLLGGAIIFRNTQNYIRSISQSDGRNVRLLAETTEALESDFTGEVYTLDWREFLSVGQQHVLAVRLVQGWGTKQPKPFRLGGEINEFGVLDFINPISEPLFNKRRYALRGYAEGLSNLAGRRMQLLTMEWRFPGSLVERGFMSPPLGIIQWSGSVFAETGAAYEETSPEEYYSSAGVELQADINLFYGITSRMRLGFASGLDKDIGEDRIYFNLGASF